VFAAILRLQAICYIKCCRCLSMEFVMLRLQDLHDCRRVSTKGV
jgi:hypothetical protein